MGYHLFPRVCVGGGGRGPHVQLIGRMTYVSGQTAVIVLY